MSDIQKLLNAMSDVAARERGRYHLTLGKLIKMIESIPDNTPVVFGGDNSGSPGDAISYRGYYSDLCFEPSDKPITAEQFKKVCVAANGETFTGYKGGEFVMSDETPLWVAPYGMFGNAIMDARISNGILFLTTKDLDG